MASTIPLEDRATKTPDPVEKRVSMGSDELLEERRNSETHSFSFMNWAVSEEALPEAAKSMPYLGWSYEMEETRARK
jgi:hypothetical protein